MVSSLADLKKPWANSGYVDSIVPVSVAITGPDEKKNIPNKST
jgi:hypothetical protein